MPQGSSASPGWFVKVINEVIKGLGQVAAYLDDVIVFDFDLTAHVETCVSSLSVCASITSSFLPRRLASAPRMLIFGATPFRPLVSERGQNLRLALNKIPMPRDLKQVRGLLGGVGYYRKSLRDLSKRIRPITSLLGKGVKFAFTIALEEIVRKIVAELAAPPILVFPDWDAVVDGSRPFNVYCGACIDGFGGALDRSNRTAPCGSSLTSAALPSIMRGTGLRLIWRLAA